MDRNFASAIGGLADGINRYMGRQQDVQEQGALEQQKSNIETQQAENLSTFKQQQEGVMTPEMGQQLFGQVSDEFGKAAFNSLTQFKQAKGRDMTIKEATEAMDPIMKGLMMKQAKAAGKSDMKHYLGNDPKGNAIFSDNEGNMSGPDKQPYNGPVLPKSSTMPTAQARSTGEFAATIRPHITEMRDLIQQADKAGYIGPMAGRVYGQFLTGKVGSTGNQEADRLLGRLRAMDSLLKTGAMKVHFGSRGGQNMYEHFSEMLNSGKQSAAVLNGALDTMDSFMMGYQQAGQPQGISVPKGGNSDPLGIR